MATEQAALFDAPPDSLNNEVPMTSPPIHSYLKSAASDTLKNLKPRKSAIAAVSPLPPLSIPPVVERNYSNTTIYNPAAKGDHRPNIENFQSTPLVTTKSSSPASRTALGSSSRSLACPNLNPKKAKRNQTTFLPSCAIDTNNFDYPNRRFDLVEDLCNPSVILPRSPSAKESSFPIKLHRILCNPDFHGIISWLPHGRSWRVLKPKAFEEKVIPIYFRHCRYSSFMRQVNGWGFKRVYQGADLNSYYHEVS
uniref:HSF-type DNA-binding domain-containing protein n=1 Tax=Ditylum brightwellii TaxID=49249 RepID=A0A7S4SJD5_9STRA